MDLICRNKFDGAFYHVLHDCVVPNICNIKRLQERNGSACYDTWQGRWIKLFAPNSNRVGKCTERPSKDKCAVSAALNRLLPVHAKPSDIVVLQRSNTRIFEPRSFAALCSQLRTRGRVVVYKGTESAQTTVQIFQKARYLVGYHGAGLVNAFFMNNGTRILEISTYQDLNNTVPWRSNMKEVTKYGSYEQRVLRVPLQQLLEANNVSHRDRDPDHFVKNLRHVSLTREDIQQIVEFERDPAVSLQGK